MALSAHMRLKGETQGEIKGSVIQQGREGSILIIATDHEILASIDESTGQVNGQNQHRYFTVTKDVDKSTPLLYRALSTNENIIRLEIRFYQPSQTGEEVQYYTVKLTNANVASIRHEMLNNRYQENMRHKEREHISFSYEKIAWILEIEGIITEDYWDNSSVNS